MRSAAGARRTQSAILLLALSLAGCSGPQPKKEEDAALKELQTRLPGRYDNATQVRLDERTGAAAPQPPIDLLIAPADAAFIGNTVFYVRETSSGDARRVLSQYIWVFGRTIELHNKAAHSGKNDPSAGAGDDPANAGRLEQHIYQFKEPQRWIHVGEQPELLESLLPQDLQRLTGCELLWIRGEKGFTAERHSLNCDPQAKSEGQLIEQKAELSDTHLSLLEQQITPDGLVDAPAGSSDPYYRFVRRGSAN
jgi:hypothetical protein